MHPFRLLFTAAFFSLVLLFTFSNPCAAATKAKAPPPVDSRILIKSVDVPNSTIEIKYMRDAKQPTHTYKIDEITQLTVNGTKGTVAQIKPGMVVGEYVERDGDTLDSISLTGYGEDTSTTKPTTKPKPKPTTPSQT